MSYPGQLRVRNRAEIIERDRDDAMRGEEQNYEEESAARRNHSDETPRDLDVAMELLEGKGPPPLGRRGKKRNARFENKLLPSKVNKTDDMIHVPTTSEENDTRVAGNLLPPQPAVTREEMVKNFMRDSRMNHKYSQECLEKNGWDYEKAAENFMELQGNGSIPTEAFQI